MLMISDVPKKPLIAYKHQQKAGYKHRCPSCNCAVGYLTKKKFFRKQILVEEATQYCIFCGQSIDWSDCD